MKFIPFQDRNTPPGYVPDWRVEALNGEDAYITIFSGPDAETRAKEYAEFKNNPPTPSSADKLIVEVQNGRKMTLHLNGLRWSYDARKNVITARPKDVIEPVEIAELGGGDAAPQS